MPISARAQRLARGWIVGLVATTVAAVSHTLAGGYRPGLLSFGIALVFAGLLGTAVIGRRPSLPRLSVAVGVSQLAFHLVFSLLGGGAGAGASGAAASMTGSGLGMPGMASMEAHPGAPLVAVAAGHDHLADPGMWIAHTVAAALTVVFLRKAELAVWGMLTRVLSRVTAFVVPVLSARHPATRGVERPSLRPLTSRLLVTTASRRGPPLLSF